MQTISSYFSLVNHLFGMSLHFTMFIPSLERLATETQKAKWLPLATNFRILGTYAQTEMGHGKNRKYAS